MARMQFKPLSVAVALACVTLAVSEGVKSADYGIPYQYKGLAVWAFLWAGLDAFGIGANDVANSFANAVAAKTVTYSQAVMIACVAEFVGCMALGKNVTDTIRKKIVNVDLFLNDPYMIMLGMSCTSIGSAVWVVGATFLGMPVSTTHATVGAVMGIGIAAFGQNGVIWGFDGSFAGFGGIVASWFISPIIAGILAAIIYLSVKFFILSQPDEVSFRRGMQSLPAYAGITFGIVGGFMIFKGIPLAGKFSEEYEKSVPTIFGVAIGFGLIAFGTFVPWCTRFISDNEDLPWYTIPYILCVRKGAYGYYEEGTHDYHKTQASRDLAGASPSAAPTKTVGGPYEQSPSQQQQALQMMAGQQYGNRPSMQTNSMGMPVPPNQMGYPMGMPQGSRQGMPPQQMPPMGGYPQMGGYPVQGMGFGNGMMVSGGNFGEKLAHEEEIEERPRVNGVPMYYTTNDKWYDTYGRKLAPGFYIDIDALCDECAELHSHANHFFDKTERLYKVLQITSCFFSSLSHGANDIANAIGPLSAVWAVYRTGTVDSKSEIDPGVLAYGGICLDLGLIFMGHNIMMVLGSKITYQTPSRGFCMELGAMFTVLIFSKLGVPVSTTHCITGATVGVGLCNGTTKALNWNMLLVIAFGWVITCVAAGVASGLIFWALATTPHATPGNGFFGSF
eukprot:CAMPEP_0173377650 /NCGR_PEP_ID=MMETSP1356-20130122/909_1 /TAXON_ID=77927 ORGANISM="Hemiselmis virescens, Strain PCC157" /NCGR_SAMPLE_ID=MMETSP1356 /ASSEMBLY_ACC=CAM_ASM_000847 /LENGTH=672 /DNA_ID=CAMNT_0014330469 /DNA_START=27 /DNA_END=2045 /DNA_ORIENTATION=-